MIHRILPIAALGCALYGQPDPAYAPLEKAYAALRDKSYDEAIQSFWKAITAAPDRANIRKDLAYTYLRIGETAAARDQFAEVIRLDPSDIHSALEYAFLCNETKQQITARRIFDKLRKTGNPVAEQAYRNIDGPLEAGIARWQAVVAASPENFSAHHELAQLAELRDELELSATHFLEAWRLKPILRELLVDLGRVRKAQGRMDEAMAALLAASRGGSPRVSEQARLLLPSRYPYVYEFKNALALDTANTELRRELAYLLLAMEKREEAESQFAKVLENDPNDSLSMAQLGFLRLGRNDPTSALPLLEKAMRSKDEQLTAKIRSALKLPALTGRQEAAPEKIEAKTLAERSIQSGYLKDALKYLKIAHEADPLDYGVMLKLGWTNNILRDDKHAVHWFRLALKSPDPKIAAEASKAYKNLRPSLARVRTTAWLYPFYSSRWKDTFSYGQIKTEFRLGSLPVRPYLSTRLIGDTRGLTRAQTQGIAGPYLSESSFIFGVGLRTESWKGLMAWAEAGTALRYVQRADIGKAIPDYRGGLSFARGFGNMLGGESHGAFFETNGDAVYVSRFDDDTILYSQNRAGYTLPETGPLQTQIYWNFNATGDAKRQYWANFVEQGPGLKLRFRGLNALHFSVNAVRGQFTVREGNPAGPLFYDLRVGLWYAFTY